MRPSSDTIAAIATPPGRGGIGIVRVSGPAALDIAVAISGLTPSPRSATRAAFLGTDGEVLDQGLLLFFPAPRSYTGEAVLELHAHGGPVVLRLLLARCVALGARLAEPGEFTLRAFLNGKVDLAQAEGVADLIDAATATAARAAVRSLSGAFSREIHALVDDVVELRMLTEATLDFPEEEIDLLRPAVVSDKLAAIREGLATLLARAQQGARLREGLSVVLIGEPNVGKSSLLNQLAGDDVAIVTAIAGTTRDTVASQIEIGGIPLTIIDTAGLRPTDDAIETIGIERTWAAVGRADLALVLADARDGAWAERNKAIVAALPPGLCRLIVHNKVDLLPAPPSAASPSETSAAVHVWVSAKTGAGLDGLRHAILEAVGASDPVEGAFLARERHLAALRQAHAHLASAADRLDEVPLPVELFAEELRLVQAALGAITGEFSADDLLGVIFSRFCIGK